MPEPSGPPRLLKQNDALLRFLNPLQWDRHTVFVSPAAFEDQYNDLSLFVARIKCARSVLEYFGSMRGIKKKFFGGRAANASAQEMWSAGFGVATISYRDLLAIGLHVVPVDVIHQYDRKGHLNVFQGQEWSVHLAARARALGHAEIFQV
jgi:hypothetical protein